MQKFGLKKQLGALPERKDYILTLAVLAVACVLSGLLVNFDGSAMYSSYLCWLWR